MSYSEFQNGTVDIIETDFRNIFHNKYQYDDSVAFAHCISADLNNRKSLSAGVATVFKNQFGKPKNQDCITNRLSYQKVHNGASVYGLITKPHFFKKPELDRYNYALKEFRNDLQ